MIKTIIAVLIGLLIYKYANIVITILGVALGVFVLISIFIGALLVLAKIPDWFAWVDETFVGKRVTKILDWLDMGDGKDRSFKLTRGSKED